MKLLALSLVTFLTAACGATSTGLTSADVTCGSDSSLTYANFGESFISDNCLSCHNTQRPVLTTQAAVASNANAILQEAVYTDSMPDGGSLTTDERQLLGEWLSCGAP